MKIALLSLLASSTIGLASLASASPIDFDLKDPKGVNNIVFLIDAPLESINGTATGISGTVSYDPTAPEATKGKLVVAVESMSVANPKMVEHMMGDKWMDAAKYPEMTFELKSLSGVSKSGTKVSATAHGVMTIKGVSKEMTTPVSFTYLEGKLEERQRTPGDILVVRAKFTIQRSDFGVNAGAMEDKVGDEIELSMSLAGIAPKA